MAAKDYKCDFCNQTMVKLWRPENNPAPLICAKCAEMRQSERTCNEYVWSKDNKEAKRTGRKVTCKKWVVDEEGQIPEPYFIGSTGKPVSKTTTLPINLNGEVVKMVPATEKVSWRMLPTYPKNS